MSEPEVIEEAWSSLQRYAGWLGRDRDSNNVRAALAALGEVLNAQGTTEATTAALEKVASMVARLEAVDLQPLFIKALEALSAGLGIE
jgi:hypothetical protein